MSNNRELKIVIKADGSVAVTELDKVGKEITGLGRTTKKSGDDLKKYQMSWADLATGINQAWEILGKTRRVMAAGWDLSKQGAQLAEARDAFSDYARSVGQNSNEILSKLKAASGGTIDDMGLIVTASKAMSLGVTKDADKLANLLQIARNKARLFGMDTSQAFEDIVTGIGRGSPLILDNLGIKIPDAFKKATEGMDETKKVAELLELTIKEGNKQLDEMGGLVDSRADKYRKFSANVENLTTKTGALIDNAITPLVNVLNDDLFPILNDVVDLFGEWESSTELIEKNLAGVGFLKEEEKVRQRIEALRLERKEAETAAFRAARGDLSGYDKERFGLNYVGARNATADDIQAGATLRVKQLTKDINSYINKLEELKSKRKELHEEQKKQIDGEIRAGSSATNSVNDQSKAVKEVKESYIDLFDATSSVYQLHRKSMPTLVNLEGGLTSVAYALEDMIDNTGASGTELLKIPFLEVAEQAAELANNIDLIKEAMGSGFDRAALSMAEDTMQYMQSGIVGYFDFMSAAPQQTSMWDAYGGNILSAVWGAGSTTQEKQQRENLSKIVAEGIQAGFNNADWSNIGLTIGNVLQNVISRSVSAQNPVFSAGGDVNWGNLGINLAVNYGTNFIASLFSLKEKNKEVIQQAATIKEKMTGEYLKTFETELLPYIAGTDVGKFFQEKLRDARDGIAGTSIGYRYEDDLTIGGMVRNYELRDIGATEATKVLEDWNEYAERENRHQQFLIDITSARGYDFQALERQAQIFEEAVKFADTRNPDQALKWSDGSVAATDVSEELNQLYIQNEELRRQLGSARAGRQSITDQAFMNYAPWIDTVPYAIGESTYPAKTDEMATRLYYDAFAEVQTDFMDRNIDPFMLEMVKSAGTGRFELESLKITDEDAYQEEYMSYLDKQLSIFEEVMRRQEEIFSDEAATYEERAAALEDFERTMDAYHQTKLDKLRREKQLEEEEKRLMAEQSMAKIEAGLSLVGELSQRGDKVLIIQGGDVQEAIDEMMAQFADNPEMIAILQKAKKTADDKALWG